MDHEIYLSLMDLENKYKFLYDTLVNKGVIEEKKDVKEEKENA